MNGTVTLALYKGNIDVAGRKSETSLYRPDVASFTMGASYDQKDAEGFIRILGLPARSRATESSAEDRGSEVKMWSGRFSQAPNAEFEQWQRSFPFDRILLPYEVAASKAHAAALAKAGVLNSDELSATLVGARSDRGARACPRPTIRRSRMCTTTSRQRLVEIAGEVGYKLHTGRSRNEQIATDLRLYVREQIDAHLAVAGRVRSASS